MSNSVSICLIIIPEIRSLWFVQRTTGFIGFTLGMCIDKGPQKSIWIKRRPAICSRGSSFTGLWLSRWTAPCAAMVVQPQGSVPQPLFTCWGLITAGHLYSLRKTAAKLQWPQAKQTAHSKQTGRISNAPLYINRLWFSYAGPSTVGFPYLLALRSLDVLFIVSNHCAQSHEVFQQHTLTMCNVCSDMHALPVKMQTVTPHVYKTVTSGEGTAPLH